MHVLTNASMVKGPIGSELPPRLRRTLELVYRVEGVVAARVWQLPGKVAVGVRGSRTTTPLDLLVRIESAIDGLREPDETWEFGILEDEKAPIPRT